MTDYKMYAEQCAELVQSIETGISYAPNTPKAQRAVTFLKGQSEGFRFASAALNQKKNPIGSIEKTLDATINEQLLAEGLKRIAYLKGKTSALATVLQQIEEDEPIFDEDFCAL